MKISVIIPTLNEADYVAATIASVRAQEKDLEIIVVDAGSSDDTQSICRPLARVLSSARGRAAQMNAGAAVARGDVFLFLHADTLLPAEALSAVRRAVAQGAEGGAFRLSFDRDNWLLRLYALGTRLPWRLLCFGDRGLFVRRSTFQAVGGFPSQPIFEDLELVRLLRRRGRFHFLPQRVTTAARRFERHGIVTQQLRNTALWLCYVLRAAPERVAWRYRYD